MPRRCLPHPPLPALPQAEVTLADQWLIEATFCVLNDPYGTAGGGFAGFSGAGGGGFRAAASQGGGFGQFAQAGSQASGFGAAAQQGAQDLHAVVSLGELPSDQLSSRLQEAGFTRWAAALVLADLGA